MTVLYSSGASNVTGYTASGDAFLADMTAKKVTISITSEVFRDLPDIPGCVADTSEFVPLPKKEDPVTVPVATN